MGSVDYESWVMDGLRRAGLSSLVLGLIFILWDCWYRQDKAGKQAAHDLAVRHGCQRVHATLPYKYPFALDLLLKQYKALPSGRLLEFQGPYLATAPTIRISILGDGYILTDPANINAVLNTHFEDYVLGARSTGLRALLGEGIFTQDGPAWKHSRELLRRQFARLRDAGLAPLEPHVHELLANIDQTRKASPDGIVDLQPLFFEYTLGTTTDLLFGEPHSSLPEADRDALRDNFDSASLVSAKRLRLADLYWVYTPASFRRSCRTVQEWGSFFASKAIDYLLEHGEKAASERYPFIVDLWRDMQDRDLVRDQLLHVLIAGRDTTACLLSWTFFHLVRNPHLVARLKKEIAQVIPGNDSNVLRSQIQQLPFLRCVLNETLRLYPQLPVNVRFAIRPTVLPRGGGADGLSPVLLTKGTGVGWSSYHLHRREDIYGPDAGVYRPERWESGSLLREVGPKGGFLDFHAGPRVCLGKDYALMEASLAVVRMLQTYPDICLPPGESHGPVGSERQNLTITLSSAEGTKVLLQR
ncbi:unnamed protein product [Discula destructiva]